MIAENPQPSDYYADSVLARTALDALTRAGLKVDWNYNRRTRIKVTL